KHFTSLRAELDTREKLLDARLDTLQEHKDKAAATAKKMKKRYHQAKDDYDELQAREQEEVDGGPQEDSTDMDASSVEASGNVKKAIQYALAQVGDAYTWGGTGPDAFDCSGLTMKAFQAAGINIGRVTYDQ